MKSMLHTLRKHLGTLATSLAWLAAFAIVAVGALA